MKRPAKEKIVAAQAALLVHVDLGEGDPFETCWACGAIGPTERAHIVPARLGGGVEPTNFFLLCSTCHLEQPDDGLVANQLHWLLRHESQVERVGREARRLVDAVARGEMTEERALELARGRLRNGGDDG